MGGYYYRILLFLSALKMTEGNDEHNIISNPINLSGKQLKVVIAQFGSHSQIYRNATGFVTGYGGIFYEELNWISQRLNISLEMVPSKDNLLGTNKNGTWNGITGQLQREEVDLACAPYSGSYSSEVLDLAVYVVGDSFGIFVKYPAPKIAIDGPIATFSLNVWIGLLVSIVACIGFIHILNFLARKYLTQTQYPTITVSNTWLYIFGTVTNHSVNGPQNGPRSVRLVVFTWVLATFVFVNIYSSCMASYMSLRFQRPEISTFEDLANNPHYQPTTIKAAAAEHIFLDAKSGIMGKIGDKIRQCNSAAADGGCSLSHLEKIVEHVLEGNFVGILPITVGEYYVNKTISNRQCKLTMGQETMAFMNLFMGAPKNSPYVKELNKESFWWNSLGLQKYWMNKLMPVPRQCHLQYNNNGESVELVDRARLKLEQFSVAFIVLFIGYVLALIQFLRERFIPY